MSTTAAGPAREGTGVMKRYQVWSDDAAAMVGTFEAESTESALKQAHGADEGAYDGNAASYRVSADGGKRWTKHKVRVETVPEWSIKGGASCDAPGADDDE